VHFSKRFFIGVALTLVTVLPASSASAQEALPVDVKNFTYAPTEIHIAAGQAITWTNDDFIAHTITADDGSFDSGYLNLRDTFTQQFDTPGTYQYYCLPHGGPRLSGMAATIVVEG
jgi:plastocyanin